MNEYLIQKLNSLNKPYKIYTEDVEETALEQFVTCMEEPSIIQGALMADTHAGYTAPIGSVLKADGRIYPSFCGYDIGCGMSSTRYNISKEQLDLDLLKARILELVPIGKARFDRSQNMAALPQGTPVAEQLLSGIGSRQLGTLGSGNHFIEIGEGKDKYLSVVIHSGSRGFGKQIAEHHMREAAVSAVDPERYGHEFVLKNQSWLASCKDDSTMLQKFEAAKKEFIYRRTRARVDNIEGCYSFDINSQGGKDYIQDMTLAQAYALANREAMVNAVTKAIKEQVKDVHTSRFINRNHNHADIKHGMVIHRKGATHAEEGMFGIIPGDPAHGSFIVKGKGNLDSLQSSSHGAGRLLSRRKAKEQLSLEAYHTYMKDIVTNHTDDHLDESPDAYKSIYEVMDLQKDLVEIIDHVKPVLNIKG